MNPNLINKIYGFYNESSLNNLKDISKNRKLLKNLGHLSDINQNCTLENNSNNITKIKVQF